MDVASTKRTALIALGVVALIGLGFVGGMAWSDSDGDAESTEDDEPQFADNPFATTVPCLDIDNLRDEDWYTFGPEPRRSVSYRMLVEEQVEAGEVPEWVLGEMTDDSMSFMHDVELLEFDVHELALPAATNPEDLDLTEVRMFVPASSFDDDSLERGDLDVLVAPASETRTEIDELFDHMLEGVFVVLGTSSGELHLPRSCSDGSSIVAQLLDEQNDQAGSPLTAEEIGERLSELPSLYDQWRAEVAPTPWEERDPTDRHLFEEDAVPLEIRQQISGIDVRVATSALSEAGLGSGMFCSRQPIAEGGLCTNIDPTRDEISFTVSAYRPEPVTILHQTGDFESGLRGEEVVETEVAVIPVGDYPDGVDLSWIDGAWVVQPG